MKSHTNNTHNAPCMLDALAMAMANGPKDTTFADPSKAPGVEIPTDKLLNLPLDLATAIERMRALETALDDLSRASEIAQYSGQFEVLNSFRAIADDLLLNKIMVDHSEATEMNITIIE